jgi:hypothetical protein
MKIKQLTDVIWETYQEGRPKSTAQTFSKRDILQQVTLAYGAIIRQRYLESKKTNDFGEVDYSITSPILDIKEFKLSDPNTIGMRRADMNAFDLYRLPNNGHITNIYPIGGNCGSEEIGKITLVKNGEEKFYTNSKFSFFLYAVVVGRGLNIFNLPACVTKVGVETTYNSDDIDVTLDIGFEIANHVLGTVLKIPGFLNKVIDNSYSPPQLEVRTRMQQQSGQGEQP